MNVHVRNFLIKVLGGYTKKEYNRVQNKYQGLLDSKTNNEVIYITNEYLLRLLKDLDDYAKKNLYGIPGDDWASRMYNVIHNNFLRIMVRYVHMKSNIIYRLDTTLESDQEFLNIIKEERNEEALGILNNDNYEV